MVNRKGFSLVEVLISLVLGAFLIAGVGSLFIGQIRTGELSHAVNEAQENARLALNLVARDLSQAGFMGDLDHTMLNVDAAVTFHGMNAAAPVAAADDCVGGDNNASFPNLASPYSFRALHAEHKGVASLATLEPCTSVNYHTAVAGSDVLQLKRFIAAPGTSLADMPAGTDLLDPIALSESSNRYYAYANFENIVFYPGDVATAPAWNTAVNGRVFQYQHHVWWVGDDGGQPSLFHRYLLRSGGVGKMSSVSGALVPGIEALAFQFGLDVNGDFIPDRYIATDDMTVQDWEGTNGKIITAKVEVLGRSTSEDQQHKDTKTYTMSSGTFGPYNDTYHRILISTVVKLRNIQ
ncbi:prepilin-type N-terminal cleavage/methylation domain-containing protein [Corallincola luteus]|uniref:Prepilin-type N-terminal cleavage/methylation domain-containing protein n=1 Tax=Corallincola luteus TaxID=1775177 RepID=A0ABY2AHM0_9GAMM|nr:PilW family protein [Corallincola luteus]TCI02135.1 prepilin-type N-terminal cleavage/methylation domain-containing protein [Corallincola luteus]